MSPPRRGERGITMVLVALAMIAIIAIAALSIDVITLFLAREEAQRSADAAALAAARVISLSGMTGDPNNTATWQAICGGPASPASLAAKAVATQSAVGGTVANPVSVMYSAGGAPVSDCSNVTTGAFGVNPLVTVQITRSNLPTFFSRIWGNTGNSVSATATAEAFNPSASDINTNGGATGTVTPVQPSCVKPLMVPNQNPNSLTCSGATCPQFVLTPGGGSIVNAGIRPTSPTGVIGERFTLAANCKPGAGSCRMKDGQPQANGTLESRPNLEYVPGEPPPSSVAVPSCATPGNGANSEFEPAVAGCDQNTTYQCGVQSSVATTPNQVDLTESPAWPEPGDTANAVACLLTNDPATIPLVGQDVLDTSSYPYKIIAGSANPLGAGVSGSTITSSNSIMSLPIYDSSITILDNGGTTNVTIVGFLQVFINDVHADGSLDVYVLNVAGCGDNASTTRAVTGTSPVPVRLVTPP